MVKFRRVPEKGMVLMWQVDFLPSQDFKINLPECFTAKNVPAFLGFWKNDIDWKIGDGTAEGTAADEIGQIHLRLFADKNDRSVRWQMAIRNKSDRRLEEVAAFNCLNLWAAPLFRDLAMERTKVKNSSGQWILLKDVPKRVGKRTLQFYAATGGIAMAEHPLARKFEVTSDAILAGDRIYVESTDGKWKLENIVEGRTAFFFNNWEQGAGCIHTAPLYGTVDPGEEVTAQGCFKFSSK